LNLEFALLLFSAFVLINAYQAAILLWKMAPIKFTPEEELIYKHFFGTNQLQLSRQDFKTLLSVAEPLRYLQGGQSFAKVNQQSYHLSLLVKGQMQVTRRIDHDQQQQQKNNANGNHAIQNDHHSRNPSSSIESESSSAACEYEIHTCNEYDFIDSPELFVRQSQQKQQQQQQNKHQL
jgi:hypothetical protein